MQTDTEKADASKVNKALEHLKNGNLSEAEPILSDVCSRCPDEYEYAYTDHGTRYIKFWDMQEFMTYVAAHRKEGGEPITWLYSAYPRACYHLAFVLIEKNDITGAIRWLTKGQSLEPENPRFLLELGVAHARLKEHQKSYDCYVQAYEIAGASKQVRAAALRGMGVQLIDLGRLDEAEARLRESLTFEADNANAKGELAYIAELRSGRKPQPQKLWRKLRKPRRPSKSGADDGV
jgi:tetratricopeptide (TPR) repeat protein